MADLGPKRADTSSTIATLQTARESEDAVHIRATSPRRSYALPRRGTISHRKLVFCDPVAFRYLEEDDSTIVLTRRERLQGYELYIVEQWVCSRVHPTFVITTYTGEPSHSILVGVLAVPHDEKNWSKRLQIYFEAVSQFHAREHETPLGTIMITNLSAFPSALSVIGVPDGDVKKHREDFIVNENLKRMGCGGRAAMTLQPASSSVMAKFHHLYQTSESIPFKMAVLELVRLCQTALALYGKLNSIYADGLLCDITEKAINDWWNDIGTDFHNVEPSDGVLGPTTVSALIGLLIGAYNRIRATGITVPKDVLDVLPMKRSIGHFQKSYKLNKTRRLDRETLDRLHRTTAKIANSEGWAVPRAVKSTVAELSGKGGEMVLGAIGASKDKTPISEVETLDIIKLSQLVPGAKMKWLWQGKPLKSSRGEFLGAKGDEGLNGRIFSTDEKGNFIWTSDQRGSLADTEDGVDATNHDKSGLRKLRGAVGLPGIPGLRSHHNRLSRQADDYYEKDDMSVEPKTARTSKEHVRPDHMLRHASSFYGRNSLERREPERPTIGLALAAADPEAPQMLVVERSHTKLQDTRDRSDSGRSMHREQVRPMTGIHASDPTGRKHISSELKKYRNQLQADEYQNFATEFEEGEPETIALRRSKSAMQLREVETPIVHSLRLPRQLSFSLVEGSVLKFTSPGDESPDIQNSSRKEGSLLVKKVMAKEMEERELKQLVAALLVIERNLLLFAEAEVIQIEGLDQEVHDHLTELNNIYYQRLDEYQSLQATSRDLVAREKASLHDGLRRIEMSVQKLDYELDALLSRIQEVEDGSTDFERNIVDIEARVAELVHEQQGAVSRKIDQLEERSLPWFQKVMNFFGPSSS